MRVNSETVDKSIEPDDLGGRWHLPPMGQEEIAAYVINNSERIRAVARRKIRPQLRPYFDSEDVLSSVIRCLVIKAQAGRVRPHSEAELWCFVRSIAQKVTASKVRLAARARDLAAEDGDYARLFLANLKRCESEEDCKRLLFRLSMRLTSEDARRLFWMRTQGIAHVAIGRVLKISADASRQRWHEIRGTLKKYMQSVGDDRE